MSIEKLNSLSGDIYGKFLSLKGKTIQNIIDNNVVNPDDPEMSGAAYAELWSSRFSDLETKISDGLNIDRTSHLRDYFLTVNGFSDFFRGDVNLENFKAESVITLNGFTTMLESAGDNLFAEMNETDFDGWISDLDPANIIEHEVTVAKQLQGEITYVILNDTLQKVMTAKQDFFNDILGFKDFINL